MFPHARIPLFVTLSFALAAAQSLAASAAPSPTMPRVNGPVDESHRVVLHGNVHPLAQARFDRGAVEGSFPAERLLLLLKRSDAQEAELQDLIQALHTPGDPSFHQWLKPDEFGRRFGPADSDVAAVIAWLQSLGFTVNQVHPGRGAIEFSGTAGQVRDAFHTGIHRYEIKGETHVANAWDPEIPAALAPVIAGLAPMNSFHAKSFLKVLGRAEFNAKTHEAKPEWTYPNGAGHHPSLVLAPGDFAVQYNINPVYKSGINGAGQSIAIVGRSNLDLSLVQNFRKLFGLPANLPEVVVDGSDPGQNGYAAEAYLDVEWSNAVAPGAKVILYTSDGTALTDGLALAAYRAVGDDIAGMISTSFGACEADLGQGGNAFWNAVWQQAAAQGQTSFVAAGDSGSAGCDDFDTQEAGYYGLAVSGIGSTPYNISVGGTDFYMSDYASSVTALDAQIASYWSGFSSGGTTSRAVSLLKPVPEQAWNDFFGLNIVDGGHPDNNLYEGILAGGGGASSAALYPGGTPAGYPKPAWQTGAGVPADKVRDLPDVSLFAANGSNLSFYPICASAGDCVNVNSAANGSAPWITGVGGTSASAPAMAGIQALVNQSTKSRQGQADHFYYPIAAQWPGTLPAFNDVTMGGNEVLCYPSTADCAAGKSGTQTSGFYAESGYAGGKGYDRASGLGSVNVANLVHWWPDVKMKATTTTLGVSPAAFVHGKQTTITSTVAPASGTGAPTGSISLTGNDGVSHYAGIETIPLGLTGKAGYKVDNLPGGAYQLTAVYGGDGTFAASKSAPVTITVAQESDTLIPSGWAWNPYDLILYPLLPGMMAPYGAQIFLDATPVGVNATSSGEHTPATGTVTFADKLGSSTISSIQPLNVNGVAEWETGIFAPGSHTVTESYSGDASYKSSTSLRALGFTVIPGSTTLTGGPLTSRVAAGGSVTVDAQLFTGYLPLYGNPPTGNVKVTLGNVSKFVPWQAFGPTKDSYLEALVTFTGVPAGILPVTATYAGDANWLGAQANFGTVIALSTLLTPTVTLTPTSTSPLPGQLFTITAMVKGPTGRPGPTGAVILRSDDGRFYAQGTLSNGAFSAQFTGGNFLNGANIVYALYAGDTNYTAGTSNAIDITVSKAGFELDTLTAEVSITPNQSGAGTLEIKSMNAFAGAVTLTVSATAGITVMPASSAPVLAAGKTTPDVVTIKVSGSVTAGTYPVVIEGTAEGGQIVHDVLILVKVP